MNRSIRLLTRPILIFTALVTLIALAAHPAAPLRAQEGTPPSPTATSSSTTTRSDQPPPQSGAVAVNAVDRMPAAPAWDSATQARQAQAQKPSAPAALTTDGLAVEQQTQIAPQATQPPNTFQVNIISSPTARSDSDLTYTIYFTNTSSTTYNNVLLQDGIGGNQFYRSCDSPNFTTCVFTYTGDLVKPTINTTLSNGAGSDSTARQIVWNLGTVLAGQKGRISYTTHLRNDIYPQSGRVETVLGNTVALYRDNQITSNTKLNEDQWGVLVVGPVFYITKTGDPFKLLQGDTINYEITVGNATGPNDSPNGQRRRDAQTAHNIVVYDIPPGELTNIVAQEGGLYDQSTGRVTWHLANPLNPGATTTLHFSGVVKDNLINCVGMLNTYFYASSDEMPLQDPQTRIYIRGLVDTISFVYPPAAVALTASPVSVKVGEAVTWTIVAKNYWRTAISGAGVKFTLPPDFAYVAAGSTPGGVFNAQENSITWSNQTLPLKTNFDTPGTLTFIVNSTAGRKIDGNDGYAEIVQPLPQNIPSGCLRIAGFTVNVDPLIFAVKTVDKNHALPGTNVIYTVDINNISSQQINDAQLLDTLPVLNGKPFVYQNMISGPNPNINSGQTLRWDNLVVPAGSPANPGHKILKFAVKVDGIPGNCIANGVKPDSGLSQGRQVFGGNVCIDFPWIVTKTVDRTFVEARDSNRQLEFTLSFISLIDTSQDIIPQDWFLPGNPALYKYEHMTLGPDPNPPAPDPQGVITWPKINLGGHQTIVYKFVVTLPVGGGGVIPAGVYCNRGEITPVGLGYIIWTIPDACTTVDTIDLFVTKDANRHNVGLGELVTYSIYLDNRSAAQDVTGLVVSDTLPVNMTYVGPVVGSPGPVVTPQPNGQQLLKWTGVIVPSHTVKILSYKVRAPAQINTYQNGAEVTGGSPPPRLTCINDLVADSHCVSYTPLVVENRITIEPAVTPASAKPGDIVTYSISLVNINDISYDNTVVTDTLPLGFTYVDTVSGPAPLLVRPDVLVWRNQTVPPKGATAGTLTYVFRAKAPLSYGSFRSRVEATSPTGIIPTADNVARVLIVPPTPALSLVAPRLIEIGSDVMFKISLINPTAAPLTNVTLTDPLPSGFTYTSVENGSQAPQVNGRTLTWNIPTVPAAGGDGTPGLVEIVFHASAPNAEGTATNTVTATGGGVAIDQTYNTVNMIIAKLRYVFLPIVSRP